MTDITIKKQFQDLIELLESNKNKSVSTILDQAKDLAKSKQVASTVYKNDAGQITHIYCWYHKKWEAVEHFGSKKSHHTGYNTMCKMGVNSWTKQQRIARQLKENLLDKIANKEVDFEDIEKEQIAIERERKEVIIPRTDKHGFDSLEDIK